MTIKLIRSLVWGCTKKNQLDSLLHLVFSSVDQVDGVKVINCINFAMVFKSWASFHSTLLYSCLVKEQVKTSHILHPSPHSLGFLGFYLLQLHFNDDLWFIMWSLSWDWLTVWTTFHSQRIPNSVFRVPNSIRQTSLRMSQSDDHRRTSLFV